MQKDEAKTGCICTATYFNEFYVFRICGV